MLFNLSVLAMAIYIIVIAVWIYKLEKENADLKSQLEWFGYKPNARDGDGDGIIQEGTRFERKLNS
jgi:hypothetical protein